MTLSQAQIADTEFRARLAALGAADLAEAAVEQRSVEQELTRIATSVAPEIGQIESEITNLENHRVTLLAVET